MTCARSALKVVIADDSALVRDRMASMLKELTRVEVVAESVDVPGTLHQLRRIRPHVLILDMDMPGGSGMEVLRIIQSEEIPSLVIVLTNHCEPEYEEGALRGGAAAFLDKSRDFLKAVEIIRSLADPPPNLHNASPPLP